MLAKFEKLIHWFDLRKTLLVMIVCLLLIALNLKWQDFLRNSLASKQDELGESLALVNSSNDLKGREKEAEAFSAIKAGQFENWTDSIPAWVSEQKLILRQVRPMGTEQRGKVKEEKVFLQVDGSMDGLMGFLHKIASEESPIYVNRFLISTRIVGSGFVSVELVLSRVIL